MKPRFRNRLFFFTLFGLIAGCFPLVASGQDNKPAEPAKPKPPTAPPLDKLLDELSKLDPKVLAEHRTKLQAEQNKLNGEIAKLKKQVAQREAQAAAVKRRIDLLNVLLSKLDKSATQPKKTAASMQRPKPKEMKATMVAVKVEPKKPLLNYEQHLRPILVEKCVGCYNPDKSRG